jgi:drug/metabolite transporter (DMT)-like permease
MFDDSSTLIDRLQSAPARRMVRSPKLEASRAGILFGLGATSTGAVQMVFASKAVQAGLDGFDLAFVRYAVAGLILAPLFFRSGGYGTAGGLGWNKALRLAIAGGPLFMILLFAGLQLAPFSHAAILPGGATAVAGLTFGAWLLGERIGAQRVTGLAVVLIGLAVVGGAGWATAASGFSALGDLMFIAGGALWAIYQVLLRYWKLNPLQATASLSVLVLSVYAPAYVVLVGIDRLANAPLSILIEAVIVQGVLIGVAVTWLFAKAFAALGAGRAAVFPALMPGLAVILGWPLLGELPTATALFGLGIVAIGQAIILGVLHAPWKKSTKDSDIKWPADLMWCGR